MEKSVLVGVAPESMLSVELHPEWCGDPSECKIKCDMIIELRAEEEIDDELQESISDVVCDFLNDRGLEEELLQIGLKDDSVHWYTVSVRVAE